MLITLNGAAKEIENGLSVARLVASMEGTLPKMFVVEKNKQIIYKENYETELINEGDELEIVVFCGGG